MQQTTLVYSTIVNTLNSDFYYISFDIDSPDDVNYKGRTFSYKPTGPTTGIHELALELSSYSGVLEPPFLLVFNSQNDVVFHHSGLLRNEELIEVLSRLKRSLN
ncbi:MAG: hypothetical protein CL823_02405 [Crocinitomicaceae bacterium]|nr:hypothetical protein [Crocinitomicaceae bacterium]|tara:strand:+ start:2236 stop:2547 length:312 start_codon:yes stop_codon:yes gene_type:complete